MESKSGKICRTSRFRWVRNSVKIDSQDESWPGKERQVKGRKMHCKISLFPTSYLVSLVFSESFASSAIFKASPTSLMETQNPGDWRAWNFQRSAYKICGKNRENGPHAHRATQTNSRSAGPHPPTQSTAMGPRAQTRGAQRGGTTQGGFVIWTLPAIPD